jgi:GNAT superfamily N-acetyltransferase
MRIRRATEADEAFICDSWLRSFRDSWFAGPIPNDLYYDLYRKIINERVRARKNAQTLVAVAPDDDSVILGFACVEPPSIVHYVYVKDVFRRHGVASALVKYANIVEPVQYTFRTKSGANSVASRNFSYNPFILRDVRKDDR